MAAPTGRQLSEELDLDVQQSWYSHDGTWYQNPTKFPCAFHDSEGYLIVEDLTHWGRLKTEPTTEQPYIKETRTTHVRPPGIGAIVGYRRRNSTEIEAPENVDRKPVWVRTDPAAYPNLWDEFVKRAREYVDTGRLESAEIDYKVELGSKLAVVREAVLGGLGDWAGSLRRALRPTLEYPVSWRVIPYFRVIPNFNQWCAGDPDDALRALRAIWAEDSSSVAERVRTFSNLLPPSVISGAGTRTAVASVLLMGLDVYEYPPFRVRVFNEAYERTGYGRPERGADEAALYEHALGFFDRFIEEASKRGLTLRHRLDAQSVIWMLLDDADEAIEPDETSGAEDLQRPSDPWTPENIETLARDLLLGARPVAEDR